MLARRAARGGRAEAGRREGAEPAAAAGKGAGRGGGAPPGCFPLSPRSGQAGRGVGAPRSPFPRRAERAGPGRGARAPEGGEGGCARPLLSAAPQGEPGRGPRAAQPPQPARPGSEKGVERRGASRRVEASVRAGGEPARISLLGLLKTKGGRQPPGSLPGARWPFLRARK